jgi:hypothetical protein
MPRKERERKKREYPFFCATDQMLVLLRRQMSELCRKKVGVSFTVLDFLFGTEDDNRDKGGELM